MVDNVRLCSQLKNNLKNQNCNYIFWLNYVGSLAINICALRVKSLKNRGIREADLRSYPESWQQHSQRPELPSAYSSTLSSFNVSSRHHVKLCLGSQKPIWLLDVGLVKHWLDSFIHSCHSIVKFQSDNIYHTCKVQKHKGFHLECSELRTYYLAT